MSPTNPCAICKGACCESLVFPAPELGDQREFLQARGVEFPISGHIEVESACKHLTSCGSCGIHAERPKVCRDYKVGGLMCLITINRRRTPGQVQEICAAIDAHTDYPQDTHE
jgi:Fe-S-cluster containining protein